MSPPIRTNKRDVTALCRQCGGVGRILYRHPFEGPGRTGLGVDRWEACETCQGTGYIVWSRGVSIVPLIPRFDARNP